MESTSEYAVVGTLLCFDKFESDLLTLFSYVALPQGLY